MTRKNDNGSPTAREFEKAVAGFISDHALLHADAPVVVAVSGGADSVALLAILRNLGYECIAAHCNFHLRGDESMRDMRHVTALAEALDVELTVKDFDVEAYRVSRGISVEMACRDLRYAWFETLLDRYHAQTVAVGHHREDQAETFFLNVLRSAGISGLTGMAPRNGSVVRPLLELSRSDIEAYLKSLGLDFVNDSTNAASVYRRNWLRNEIIPAISAREPEAVSAILATMSHLSDNESFYRWAVADAASRLFTSTSLPVEANLDTILKTMPADAARMLLFESLKPYGFNITHIDNILCCGSNTAEFTTATHRATVSRRTLTVRPLENAPVNSESHTVSLRHDIAIPCRISVRSHSIEEWHPVRDNSRAWFDEKILEGNPTFCLRRWQRGDRITPFGMTGSRLVSDIFNDAKLSAAAKREAWMLTRNGKIIWAVGLRASDAFPVTPCTTRFISLRLM